MPSLLNLDEIFSNENRTASLIDPIPWLPIDEMELTDCHRMASVMPCAFPPNVRAVRKKKIIRNDREKLLNRANARIKSKEAVIAVRKANARRHKRQKRDNQRKIKKKLASSGSNTVETIDPYLVFDEAGNISVDRLLLSTAAVQTSTQATCTTQATIDPFILPPVSYSFSDYHIEALGEEVPAIK